MLVDGYNEGDVLLRRSPLWSELTMSRYSNNPYAASSSYYADTVAQAPVTERTRFIQRVYAHLLLAVLGLVLTEVVVFNVVPAETLRWAATTAVSRYYWLGVLGAFMVVTWVAQAWARSNTSSAIQYAGLGLYVLAEAVILMPLLYFAYWSQPGAVVSAALTTLGIFGGLTIFTLVTKADFSFLRTILVVGGFGAIGFILCSILFGGWFGFGSVIYIAFSCFMVVLMAGYILYNTSNVIHRYRTAQHVAAALSLFASVATLFWYVLQLFLAARD